MLHELENIRIFVGTLASIVGKPELFSLKKFNIALRAANPALALQIKYMTADIILRANKYFGYDAVNKVIVKK